MNLYESTIPVFIRGLRVLQEIMKKVEKKKGAKKLLTGRLAPDMYTFTQQIQYAYFMALEAAEQLTGKKPPAFAYDEKTFTELQTSVKRTITYLKSITPRDMAGSEKKKIKTFLEGDKKVGAKKYIQELALPNFYFHVTVAYAILRHLGIPLKKDDYLGEF